MERISWMNAACPPRLHYAFIFFIRDIETDTILFVGRWLTPV